MTPVVVELPLMVYAPTSISGSFVCGLTTVVAPDDDEKRRCLYELFALASEDEGGGGGGTLADAEAALSNGFDAEGAEDVGILGTEELIAGSEGATGG